MVSLHFTFVHFEKAFDCVPYELIRFNLRDAGLSEKYVKLMKLLYTDSQSQVGSVPGTTVPFKVTVDVRQGSAISPLLFILYSDHIIRDIQEENS